MCVINIYNISINFITSFKFSKSKIILIKKFIFLMIDLKNSYINIILVLQSVE